MKERSAGEITKIAIEILTARGWYAWRQTNLTVRGRRGIVKKGVADILCFNKSNCLFGAAEVKTVGDTIRPEQHEFLSSVKKAGGMALIATERNGEVVLKEYLND